MSKPLEYFQQELGLDAKTSEAIKILMDEGLLEPLLVELKNALEDGEYQNKTKEIDSNLNSHVEKTKEELTTMEAHLVSEGLSLEEVRERLSEI